MIVNLLVEPISTEETELRRILRHAMTLQIFREAEAIVLFTRLLLVYSKIQECVVGLV